MVTDCETLRQKTKTTAINQGEASEILAYLVREHGKNKPDQKNKKNNNEKNKKADRSSEECDARRSERLQEEQHTS